jgi:predicted TIM-barrel fold metal-dependent hydrolase
MGMRRWARSHGEQRSQALDMLGFGHQVIFSSFCARPIFEAPSRGATPRARAHNRAMAAFCSADRRLIGVAIVPLDDPTQAMAEIAYAQSLGLGAIWVAASAPGGRSPGHADHEPIWAMLAERRLPFILHVGSAPLSIEAPWMNDGRPDRRSARGGAEVIGSKDLTVIHHAAVQFISTLVLDGVLERHPTLRGGVIELGAGWVPDMIRRLDHAAEIWAKSEPHLAEMKRRPSEQIRASCASRPTRSRMSAPSCASPFRALHVSSDYPHAEGGRDSHRPLHALNRNPHRDRQDHVLLGQFPGSLSERLCLRRETGTVPARNAWQCGNLKQIHSTSPGKVAPCQPVSCCTPGTSLAANDDKVGPCEHKARRR